MSAETPLKEKDPAPLKKRKRNVLNIKDKCDIIEKLKQGQSIISISREYDVCRSTIWGIKQSESKILQFSSQIGAASHSRKTMKKSEDYNLDAAVYKWFTEQTREGAVLSNQMICDEALRLNKLFKGELDFKATRGWLRRFKARHDITNQNIVGKVNNPQDGGTRSTVDTEESCVNVSVGTPVSEKSEESDHNAYRFNGNGINSRRLTIAPEVNIKEESPEMIGDDDERHSMAVRGVHLPSKPSDEEAFNAIDTVIQWAEVQNEVNMEQLMFLRTLQGLAAKRALASISRIK